MRYLVEFTLPDEDGAANKKEEEEEKEQEISEVTETSEARVSDGEGDDEDKEAVDSEGETRVCEELHQLAKL